MANLQVNDPYTYYYNNVITYSKKINIKQFEHITFDNSIDIKSCPITLVDFEIGEQIIKLPCDHIFSLSPLEEWLKEKNTCPICRCELTKDTTHERNTIINNQLDSLISVLTTQLINNNDDVNEILQTFVEIF